DNGKRLWNLSLPVDAALETNFEADLLEGVTVISATGYRRADDDAGVLYRNNGRPVQVPVPLRFIPYYAWANRAVGEMRVWIREC
ncbi:MAG: glycoside hydrolase family 127 protein, partial [Clostridiaceae bacterium]|nr:glycoside hydrolase family 127 protein [Clostridiaceae bacterium]